MMDEVSATETEVIIVWDLFLMKLRHFAGGKKWDLQSLIKTT